MVIDRRRLLDLVDQLRAAVPVEVREARDTLNRKEEVLAQAQSEAERILEDAKRDADAKREEGGRLASEQMDEADRYALEMLRKLEQQLAAFMASVRSGIDTLEHKPEEGPVQAEEFHDQPA